MPQSIGQTIKRLRKERNFTQEELAEQLNVTSQAVSKWENETGMPDISQIVPLASLFGVSTDVLFGTLGTNDDDEVRKIIEHAISLVAEPADKESVSLEYAELLEGLKLYPNNTQLLLQCLECGISLAYPENTMYDKENGRNIYQECIRQANIVISYSKNVTDILRAHMIMVLLHSAYGNGSQAREHANEFPWRADMTIHEMYSYIAHFEKDYKAEAINCQRDFMYHLEAMLDDITQLGCAYETLGTYDDALKSFSTVFSLIRTIFGDEYVLPALHYRERGDVYALMAGTYLKLSDHGKAFEYIEKMVDYDTVVRGKFNDDMTLSTPLLRETGYPYYCIQTDRKKRLQMKLDDKMFDKIREDECFKTIVAKVSALPN